MKTMKRALVALILTGLLLASGCSLLSDLKDTQSPKVEVVDQRVVGLSLDQVDLEVDVAVLNPNPFSVPMGALDYTLSIQDRRLLSGEQPQGTTLTRDQKVVVTFPVTLEFSEAASALGGLVGTNELSYHLAGGMRFDVPLLGERRVPLETDGRFPVPQLPRVSVGRLKADSVSFSRVLLILELEFSNPNVFDLQIDDFDYGFSLNSTRVAGGGLTPGLLLPAGEQVTLELPFSVSLSDLGRSGFAALVEGSALHYSLNFTSAWGSDFSPLGSLEYSAKREGRLPMQR